MNLEVSTQTRAKVLDNARAQGMSVDDYLRQLMAETAEQQAFVAAVEVGLKDEEEDRVRPAREALAALGARLGFPNGTGAGSR